MDPEPPTTPTQVLPVDVAAIEAGLSGADASSRQRSSSPWAFKLSTKAVNRVHSNEGSGVSTPVLSGRFSSRFANSGAQPIRANQAAARASHETAILTAVRRQIDTFEEKVGSQINRMQQQEQKLREAGFMRVEEKMHATEGAQPRMDRRIAELTGNFKGLSDEMQSQIRRVDSVDERLWEWRHQMEEDFRTKFSELDQHFQKAQSSSRVMFTSFEDVQKKQHTRLQRIELDAGERLTVHEEVREGLLNLHSRLEVLEDRSSVQLQEPILPRQLDLPRDRGETRDEVENNSALLSLFDRRMGDMTEKVDRIIQDSIDLHQASKQHEVQLNSLRTHFDSREEQLRKVTERLENTDIDGRLEQFRRALEEERSDKVVVQEKLELLVHRIDDQEQSYDGLRNRHDQLLHSSLQLPGFGDNSPAGMECEIDLDSVAHRQGGQGLGSAIEECMTRLAAAETSLEGLGADITSVREASDLGPRVGILVKQLTEIVPKVIEHERQIGDLSEGLALFPEQLAGFGHKIGDLNQGLASVSQAQGMLQDLTQQFDTIKVELRNLAVSQIEQSGVDKKELEVGMDNGLMSMRGELDGVLAVMQAQAQHSVKAAADIAEARSAADDVRTTLQAEMARLNGEVVTQEQFASATALLKTSLEDMQAASQKRGSPSREDVVLRHELSESLREVKEEQKLIADSSSILTSLRKDISSLKCSHESSEAVTRPQVEELCRNLRKDIVRELDCPSLADQVSDLSGKVASLRSEFMSASPSDAGRVEVAKALQQDEDAEREKQQRLMERIDELCGHIAAVDSAVGSMSRNGSVPLKDGIPAEISDQFKLLADRVEEQSRSSVQLHTNLIGKFNELDTIIRQVEGQPR